MTGKDLSGDYDDLLDAIAAIVDAVETPRGGRTSWPQVFLILGATARLHGWSLDEMSDWLAEASGYNDTVWADEGIPYIKGKRFPRPAAAEPGEDPPERLLDSSDPRVWTGDDFKRFAFVSALSDFYQKSKHWADDGWRKYFDLAGELAEVWVVAAATVMVRHRERGLAPATSAMLRRIADEIDKDQLRSVPWGLWGPGMNPNL